MYNMEYSEYSMYYVVVNRKLHFTQSAVAGSRSRRALNKPLETRQWIMIVKEWVDDSEGVDGLLV